MHILALGALAAMAAGASGAVGAGVGPGISLNRRPASFQLMVRGGVELPLKGDQLSLGLLLPARLMLATDRRGSLQSSLLAVGLVPTVRGTYVLAPRLGAYLDLGAGATFFNWTSNTSFLGDVRSWATVAEFDVGLGAEYRVHPNVALFFEPVALRFFTAGTGTTDAGRVELEFEQSAMTLWAMNVGAHVVF